MYAGGAAEAAVEAAEEPRQRIPVARLGRPEQQGGRAGVRVRALKAEMSDRDGDGQRELPEELARDARDEGHGTNTAGAPGRWR